MSELRAVYLLRENIRALLTARREDQSALALWLHHDKSWINKFLNEHRAIQLKDLDRIADFFGIATYQLFQPGISQLTERRSSRDRRAGRERRISHAQRVMLELSPHIKRLRAPRAEQSALEEATDAAAQAELDAIHKAEGGIREESKSRRKSKQKR